MTHSVYNQLYPLQDIFNWNDSPCKDNTLCAADTSNASAVLSTHCAQQTLVLHQLC